MNETTQCDNCENQVDSENGWMGNYGDEYFVFCEECLN
jgi:hypothetical protein